MTKCFVHFGLLLPSAVKRLEQNLEAQRQQTLSIDRSTVVSPRAGYNLKGIISRAVKNSQIQSQKFQLVPSRPDSDRSAQELGKLVVPGVLDTASRPGQSIAMREPAVPSSLFSDVAVRAKNAASFAKSAKRKKPPPRRERPKQADISLSLQASGQSARPSKDRESYGQPAILYQPFNSEYLAKSRRSILGGVIPMAPPASTPKVLLDATELDERSNRDPCSICILSFLDTTQ